MNKNPTDFFCQEGYRKFAMQMLLQSVDDLLLPEKDAYSGAGANKIDLRKQARDWIMFRSNAPMAIRQPGVLFEECVYAWGLASDIDRLRKALVERPLDAQKGLKDAIASMQKIGVARESQDESAILASQQIKVGGFTGSWLFSKSRSPEVAGA